MTKTKLIGVREAARVLGCTTKYVYDLLYNDRLTGAHKVGRQWRIPNSGVEARLRERKANNATPCLR